MSSFLQASKDFAKNIRGYKPPKDLAQKTTASYQYQTLKPKGEIRLLDILPGEFDGPVCIAIHHVAFDPPEEEEMSQPWPTERAIQEHLPNGWYVFERANGEFVFGTADRTFWDPPNGADLVAKGLNWKKEPQDRSNYRFETLSYTWGPDQHGEYVFIRPSSYNGQWTRISVRQNLASALRHLRYTDKKRSLWADALCIDQGSKKERSQQVQHMWKIYKYASRTIAWLGPAAQNTDRALSSLEKMGRDVVYLQSTTCIPSPDAVEPRTHQAKFSIDLEPEVWEAIRYILWREYFSRLWIVSELALGGPRAILKCGAREIEFESFRAALMCLWQKEKEPGLHLSLPISTVCTILQDLSKSSFDRVIESCHRNCSDPRDKVYGLLCLAKPNLRDRIESDYDLPVHEVYRRAFLAVCDYYQRLDLLFICRLVHRKIPGPSWVPDFEVHAELGATQSFYSFASGLSPCSIDTSSDTQLRVEGIKCAVIKETSRAAPSDRSNPNVQGIINTLQSWIPPDLNGGTYVAGGSRREAFLATIAAGRVDERYPMSNTPSMSTLDTILTKALQTQPLHNTDEKILQGIAEFLRGREFFQTTAGHFGIGPGNVKSGDVVCTFLGCTDLIILRPKAQGAWEVLGNCYVHGFCDATAFLGPLPATWRIIYRARGFHDRIVRFHDTASGVESIHDPRLGALPTEWEWLPSGRTRCDPAVYEKFRNKRSGEVITYDPRMSADALRGRGVTLEEFNLE